jgi:hypothetical protein
MSTFAEMLDSVWRNVRIVRSRIRIDGNTVIEKAVCVGFSVDRETTEQGLYGQVAGIARVKLSDVPPGKLKLGDDFEISVNGSAFAKVRSTGRKELDGVLTITLGAHNG